MTWKEPFTTDIGILSKLKIGFILVMAIFLVMAIYMIRFAIGHIRDEEHTASHSNPFNPT